MTLALIGIGMFGLAVWGGTAFVRYWARQEQRRTELRFSDEGELIQRPPRAPGFNPRKVG